MLRKNSETIYKKEDGTIGSDGLTVGRYIYKKRGSAESQPLLTLNLIP